MKFIEKAFWFGMVSLITLFLVSALSLSSFGNINVLENATIVGNVTIGQNITVSSLISCDTIDTDSNGLLKCGNDGGGGSSNIFDQNLNTTNNVKFANVTSTGNVTVSGNVHAQGNINVSRQGYNISLGGGNIYWNGTDLIIEVS